LAGHAPLADLPAPRLRSPTFLLTRLLARSAQAINYVRTIMTIAGGFAAGILGLTGSRGLAFYVALYLATSVLLVQRMPGGKVAHYVPKTSFASFLHGGMVNEALSFVLYWTFMYALVHIY
jgi:hypothetical protein